MSGELTAGRGRRAARGAVWVASSPPGPQPEPRPGVTICRHQHRIGPSDTPSPIFPLYRLSVQYTYPVHCNNVQISCTHMDPGGTKSFVLDHNLTRVDVGVTLQRASP